MTPIIIAAVLLSVTLGFAVFAYFKISRADKTIYSAHSALNVQLSFRREIVKNLSSLVSGLAQDSGEIISALMKIAVEPDTDFKIETRAEQENKLSSGLTDLFKLSDGKDALKNNENFISHKKSVLKCEEKIKQAAAFYNNSVRDYNTMISIFPAGIVAKMFDYGPAGFFNFEQTKVD
ncbi:MAG: LemA family protein [Elusimicrobium sp.]|jgi:LemA protein|nr:LemA family protein [Elusimicrobium sp.]